MKSLFSCFSQKRHKKSKKQKSCDDFLKISDLKPKDDNISDINKKENVSTISIKSFELESVKSKADENYKENDEENDEENELILIQRANNAKLRIEHASLVLEKKRRMYNLQNIIEAFEEINNSIVSVLLEEAVLVDNEFHFKCQVLAEMLNIQNVILRGISSQHFEDFPANFDRFKKLVKQMNTSCDRNDDLFELYRVLADSISIFGWINIADEKPYQFVNSTADGCAICCGRLIDTLKFKRYSSVLRLWTNIIRQIAKIVAQNFNISLMWRIDGPIPTEPLKCILELNYANNPVSNIANKSTAKIIKTKKVDEVNYDDMTNLMNDLRNGVQRNKLRKIQPQQEVNHSMDDKEVSGVVELPVDGAGDCGNCEDVVVKIPENHLSANDLVIENIDNIDDFSVSPSKLSDRVVVRNCRNSGIHIDGSLSLANIYNCRDVKFLFEDVISDNSKNEEDCLVVKGCENLEIQIIGEILHILLVRSSNIRIFVPGPLSDQFQLKTDSCCSNIELFVSKSLDGGLELSDYDLYSVPHESHTLLVDNGQSVKTTIVNQPIKTE